MNAEQDSKSITQQYLDGPRLLDETLSGLSEAGLDAAPDEENWSIRQLVHHLIDGDDLWSMAVKMALSGSDPVFDLHWYWEITQVQWSRNWAYERRDIRPALALFDASRRCIVDLVEAVPAAWEYAVTVPWPHGEPGRLTIGEILAMQSRHVNAHVDEIRAIRMRHNI